MPCSPSPCGENALCTEYGEKASCSCPPNYLGDPYVRCRPVCLVRTQQFSLLVIVTGIRNLLSFIFCSQVDSDCPNDKYCFKTVRCEDPCPGACGTNANCKAVYHRAECNCYPGYTGNPLTYCSRIESKFEKFATDNFIEYELNF